MYFIENAKIKLIIEQKFFLDRICLFQDIDLYFRIFLKKRGHDLRNHTGTPHQWESNVQFSFIIFCKIFQLFFPVLLYLQDLSGILHIFAARKGRCIAVSAAAEQLGPHFSFQFLEMLGQGWLVNIKLLCGFCKILIFGNAENVLQFMIVHVFLQLFHFGIIFMYNMNLTS